MDPPLVFSGGQGGVEDLKGFAGSVGKVQGLEANGVTAAEDQAQRLESLRCVDQVVAGVGIELESVFVDAG
jgi:hypothetical protein